MGIEGKKIIEKSTDLSIPNAAAMDKNLGRVNLIKSFGIINRHQSLK